MQFLFSSECTTFCNLVHMIDNAVCAIFSVSSAYNIESNIDLVSEFTQLSELFLETNLTIFCCCFDAVFVQEDGTGINIAIYYICRNYGELSIVCDSISVS